jgi:hypothetical protein
MEAHVLRRRPAVKHRTHVTRRDSYWYWECEGCAGMGYGPEHDPIVRSAIRHVEFARTGCSRLLARWRREEVTACE